MEDPGFYASYFEQKYPGCELVCRDAEEIDNRMYYLYQIEM